MRCGRKEKPDSLCPKKRVTSDLPNDGTISLDVLKAKAEIFGFLAVKIILAQTNTQIKVTKIDGIVKSLHYKYVSFMQSEEANTRMLVHIKQHASLTGSQTLMIVISNTYVVLLYIAGIY